MLHCTYGLDDGVHRPLARHTARQLQCGSAAAVRNASDTTTTTTSSSRRSSGDGPTQGGKPSGRRTCSANLQSFARQDALQKSAAQRRALRSATAQSATRSGRSVAANAATAPDASAQAADAEQAWPQEAYDLANVMQFCSGKAWLGVRSLLAAEAPLVLQTLQPCFCDVYPDIKRGRQRAHNASARREQKRAEHGTGKVKEPFIEALCGWGRCDREDVARVLDAMAHGDVGICNTRKRDVVFDREYLEVQLGVISQARNPATVANTGVCWSSALPDGLVAGRPQQPKSAVPLEFSPALRLDTLYLNQAHSAPQRSSTATASLPCHLHADGPARPGACEGGRHVGGRRGGR
jgi:hypothetical protein